MRRSARRFDACAPGRGIRAAVCGFRHDLDDRCAACSFRNGTDRPVVVSRLLDCDRLLRFDLRRSHSGDEGTRCRSKPHAACPRARQCRHLCQTAVLVFSAAAATEMDDLGRRWTRRSWIFLLAYQEKCSSGVHAPLREAGAGYPHSRLVFLRTSFFALAPVSFSLAFRFVAFVPPLFVLVLPLCWLILYKPPENPSDAHAFPTTFLWTVTVF